MLLKKKTIIIGLLATVSFGTLFTSTIYAVQTMEISIIKCGVSSSTSGCGTNYPATDPLQQGYVRINNDGDVDVQLKGARANTIYTVFVGNWTKINGNWQSQVSGNGPCGGVGTVTTDNVGNFIGQIKTPTGTFAFPIGTSIGQPNFAFNNPSCYPTQFTTGITIP